MAAVGHASVPRLFSVLMDLQAGNPRDLQWLAVLACWISDTAGPTLPNTSNGGQSPGSPPSDAAHLLASPDAGMAASERGRGGPLALGGAGRSALDRSAEEAFQIQVGSTGAWQEW